MKKILLLVQIFLFFFIISKTYSYKIEENDEIKNYLLTLTSVTTDNINKLSDCYYKLITIYPDNTYVDMKLYNIDRIHTINDFKKYYLKQTLNISSSKYYEYKINGIKIEQIKVVTNSSKLKKCYNYLEKVEPL